MSSTFTKNRGLSQKVLSLWTSCGERPHHITDRLRFYLAYFPEVVPYSVTIHYDPDNQPSKTTQEIQFGLSSGKLLMTGLVTMDTPDTAAPNVSQLVTNKGYKKPDERDIAMAKNDDKGTWRFFTAGDQVRMYKCHQNGEYELLGVYHPIDNAWDLAAHLQREFDGIEPEIWGSYEQIDIDPWLRGT